MKALKEENPKPIHNQYKSDVYSLGCVMIELATMSRLCTAFDYHKAVIDEQEILNRLSIIRARYSHNLANYISWMIAYNEEERPDFVALAKQFRICLVADVDRALSKSPLRDENNNFLSVVEFNNNQGQENHSPSKIPPLNLSQTVFRKETHSQIMSQPQPSIRVQLSSQQLQGSSNAANHSKVFTGGAQTPKSSPFRSQPIRLGAEQGKIAVTSQLPPADQASV